jgi:hypothetical protein
VTHSPFFVAVSAMGVSERVTGKAVVIDVIEWSAGKA